MSFFNNQGKLKFEVKFEVNELANVPLVNGFLFTKWKLAAGGASGVTNRAKVVKHNVAWHQEFKFETHLTTDKETAILKSCFLNFSIRLETNGGKNYEKIGKVIIDLAECAGSKFIKRKFLLLKSRLNSTLEVSISMRQIAGDPTFKVPKNTYSNFGDLPLDDTNFDEKSNEASNGHSTLPFKSNSKMSRRWQTIAGISTKASDKSPLAVVNEIFNRYTTPQSSSPFQEKDDQNSTVSFSDSQGSLTTKTQDQQIEINS